jgi:hypothetical protein
VIGSQQQYYECYIKIPSYDEMLEQPELANNKPECLKMTGMIVSPIYWQKIEPCANRRKMTNMLTPVKKFTQIFFVCKINVLAR